MAEQNENQPDSQRYQFTGHTRARLEELVDGGLLADLEKCVSEYRKHQLNSALNESEYAAERRVYGSIASSARKLRALLEPPAPPQTDYRERPLMVGTEWLCRVFDSQSDVSIERLVVTLARLETTAEQQIAASTYFPKHRRPSAARQRLVWNVAVCFDRAGRAPMKSLSNIFAEVLVLILDANGERVSPDALFPQLKWAVDYLRVMKTFPDDPLLGPSVARSWEVGPAAWSAR